MGSIFKSPKVPDVPPAPPDYSKAAEDAKKKAQRYSGQGRASTILTSPLGVYGEPKTTLLGE